MAKFPLLDDNFPRIIPSFRQLVKIMSECVDGGVSLGCTAFEFRQCDIALGTALGNFMEVLRLKELPPERNEAINEIVLLFTRMSSEMAKLETALSMDATAAAVNCVANIYEHLKDLEELNMDLKAAVGDSHIYSEVPVVDSLLRAGNFVLETNGAEWDALSARLEALIPQWNEIVSGSGLPEELIRHDHALERLVEVLNERNLEALPDVLEEVKSSGEDLVNFQDSQIDVENTSVVLCPYCGKPMLGGSKKCFSCGARMPEEFERGGSSDKETDKGEAISGMPEYVQRIFDVAQELPNNPKMIRPFKRAVGELRRRVADASSRINKMSSSKLKTTPEERENIDGIIDLSNTCIDNFSKAVELLEEFEPPVDRFHMQCALEVMVEAVKEMRGIGGLAQKYRNSKK
ncbi:MAG: hypothetical protein ACI38Q_03365 [Candidatus Bruticola sp.]